MVYHTYHTDAYLLDYFSKALKHRIIEKGFTQKQLAEYTGAGTSTISRYTNAQGLPGYYMLYRLAIALDCQVSDFFPRGLS
jgi:transcriptional regulator with XRE-family HTH domain